MDMDMLSPTSGRDDGACKYFSNVTSGNLKAGAVNEAGDEVSGMNAPIVGASESLRTSGRPTTFNELLTMARNQTAETDEIEKVVEGLEESYSSLLMEVSLSASPEAAVIVYQSKGS